MWMAVELHQTNTLLFPIFRRVIIQTLLYFEPTTICISRRYLIGLKTKPLLFQGEFLFPGTYRIFRGESLSNVVQRAGGFTEHAFPEGAIFTREHIRRKETAQKEQFINKLENMIAYENLEKSDSREDSTLEQSRALISRLRSIPSSGRLVIDLPNQLNNSADTEILLFDGDTLFVPKVPQEVIVSGEVQFPSSHIAENSLSVFEYIERSGGFTERSDEKGIALVKSNGMVISKPKAMLGFRPEKHPLM